MPLIRRDKVHTLSLQVIFKAAVNIAWILWYVFWGVPVRRKHEILEEGRDSLYFQIFPERFYCMCGSSLVKLMGYDNNAADTV